jgi:hypothetical protein
MAGELKHVFERKVISWSATDTIDNVNATRTRCRDVASFLLERREAFGKALNALTALTEPKVALCVHLLAVLAATNSAATPPWGCGRFADVRPSMVSPGHTAALGVVAHTR